MDQNQNTSLFGLGIDHISKNHLAEAARWAKFLAICGFIMIGMMMIYGLTVAMLFSQMSDYDKSYQSNNVKRMLGVVMFIFYGVCAVLAFFPYFFLLRFANKMKRALDSDDQTELNNSFMNLKILYRYLGILTIIGLAFIFLALISVIITAGTMKGTIS